jgi:hypothetical protein
MPIGTKLTSLVCVLTLVRGCARLHRTAIQATPELLVGRWSALPKQDAEQNPRARDIKTPLGQRAEFIYEFRADNTWLTSMKVTPGMLPVPELKRTSRFTWKVVEVQGNTLILEVGDRQSAGRAKIVFESDDRCTYSAEGGDEAEFMVLNRLP